MLARFDQEEDRTTIWSSTQSPHEVRLSLVQLFDMDDEKLRVITPDVGGGFGAKYLIYPEEVVVPLAARLLGRPVKWIEDRREHFLTSIEERDQYWDLQIAFNSQAEILAVRGILINDQGAYTPQGVNVSYNSATALPGPYRIPNYELRVLDGRDQQGPDHAGPRRRLSARRVRDRAPSRSRREQDRNGQSGDSPSAISFPRARCRTPPR